MPKLKMPAQMTTVGDLVELLAASGVSNDTPLAVMMGFLEDGRVIDVDQIGAVAVADEKEGGGRKLFLIPARYDDVEAEGEVVVSEPMADAKGAN